MDTRSARDSKSIEQLGYYDPLEPNDDKAIKINAERIMYWLGVGAQPSDTVRGLLRKRGIDAVPGKPKLIEG